METLNGFAAISAYNGWMMSAIGITIVIFGLSSLAFVISLFPRLVIYIENRKTEAEERAKQKELDALSACPALPSVFPCDPSAVAILYEFLVKDLETEFELCQLYAEAMKHNYPHPHLSIRQLREAGILAAVKDGTFRWNQ